LLHVVIPAKAGSRVEWSALFVEVPAFAGMTGGGGAGNQGAYGLLAMLKVEVN